MDFAAAVEPHLVRAVGDSGEVVISDVFEFRPRRPADLVFDHTFFCAISPDLRPGFGWWARDVVAPGGRLVSVVFPLGRPRSDGGPPFGMSVADLSSSLGGEFALVVDEPAAEPGRRSWPTRWAEFLRR